MKLKIIILTVTFLFLGWIVNRSVIAKTAPEIPPRLTNRPELEKKVFIHYKKGYGKPEGLPGGGKTKDLTCYGFLAKGLKWKALPQDYYIDYSGSDMIGTDVIDSINSSVTTWDDVTSKTLFGTGIPIRDGSWDDQQTDGRNEVVFENYDDPNVIAVTVIRGYFSGPSQSREILEFDILFNTRFDWGRYEDNSNVMDLQNIATHELGHGLGLTDMYQDACSYVTMYGYSAEGDIEKRTLAQPDITGLQQLYGE